MISMNYVLSASAAASEFCESLVCNISNDLHICKMMADRKIKTNVTKKMKQGEKTLNNQLTS